MECPGWGGSYKVPDRKSGTSVRTDIEAGRGNHGLKVGERYDLSGRPGVFIEARPSNHPAFKGQKEYFFACKCRGGVDPARGKPAPIEILSLPESHIIVSGTKVSSRHGYNGAHLHADQERFPEMAGMLGITVPGEKESSDRK